MLEELGDSWSGIDEYALTFLPEEPPADPAERNLTAWLDDTRRSDLRHALTLLSESADGQGQVTPETLEELKKVLESVLDK